MSCPYLEEVVMVFCTAYPVKKLVPRNRMAAPSPCEDAGFERCPLYPKTLPAVEKEAPPSRRTST